MTPARFEALFRESVEKIKRLVLVKGGEYAPGDDRLANFKGNAAALGLEPLAVWGVYAGKHWDSIRTFISDINRGKDRERAEPMEGRFLDLITYGFLGLGLLEDRAGGAIFEDKTKARMPDLEAIKGLQAKTYQDVAAALGVRFDSHNRTENGLRQEIARLRCALRDRLTRERNLLVEKEDMKARNATLLTDCKRAWENQSLERERCIEILARTTFSGEFVHHAGTDTGSGVRITAEGLRSALWERP